MRAAIIILAVVLVLGWLGYEVRRSSRSVSNALFALAALLVAVAVGAVLSV